MNEAFKFQEEKINALIMNSNFYNNNNNESSNSVPSSNNNHSFFNPSSNTSNTSSLFSRGLPTLLISSTRSKSFSSDPKDHSYSSPSLINSNTSYDYDIKPDLNTLMKVIGNSIQSEDNEKSSNNNDQNQTYLRDSNSFDMNNRIAREGEISINRFNMNQSPSYDNNLISTTTSSRNNSTEATSRNFSYSSLNEYQFPPRTTSNSYYSKPLSPYEHSSRNNSIDYFTSNIPSTNINNTQRRRTYSEIEDSNPIYNEGFYASKYRVSPASDRNRSWSIGSSNGSSSNYYNGGTGRIHRISSLEDSSIPFIGRRRNSIPPSSFPSVTVPSSSSSTLPSNQNLIAPPPLSTKHSSISNSTFTTPQLPSTRARSNTNPDKNYSPPRSSRSNTKHFTTSPAPSISTPSTNSQQTNLTITNSSSSSSINGNSSSSFSSSLGGAGSSKGARAFSASEQKLLWNSWNLGNYYPSHELVKELINDTSLTRSQIRGWYANRRHRATSEEKVLIAKSRGGTSSTSDDYNHR